MASGAVEVAEIFLMRVVTASVTVRQSLDVSGFGAS
jgi:hypothetical protein